MIQELPGMPGQEADGAAGEDSTALVQGITDSFDRLTEVRSLGDLWTLLGDFQAEAIEFAVGLIVALIVLLVFVGVYRMIAAGLRPAFERARIEDDAAELLLMIVKYTLLAFAVVLALDQIGFNVTGLIAGLGIAGLALGFAAKDTLANFIAGISILWDRPFRVGDRIEVDGETGTVKRMTLRSTRIHTAENWVVILPNQTMASNKVINHTMQSTLRIDIAFGIAYKEDIDQARDVVLQLVEGDDRIRTKPAREVVVTELGDSSVNMELRFWVKNPHEEWPIKFEMREKVKKALDQNGIEIPYPHLSLFVEKTGPNA